MIWKDQIIIISCIRYHDRCHTGGKACKGTDKAAIMPIPGAISSGCGLALRFMDEDEESILAFCKDAPVNGHLYKLFTQKVDGHHPVFLIM